MKNKNHNTSLQIAKILDENPLNRLAEPGNLSPFNAVGCRFNLAKFGRFPEYSGGFAPGAYLSISPDGNRFSIANHCNDMKDIRFDIYDSETLACIQNITIKGWGGDYKDSGYSIFRTQCFFDNNHIAVGGLNGILRIIHVPDKRSWERWIGSCVEVIGCSSNHLAVSVFPSLDGKHNEYRGIKLYKIKKYSERISILWMFLMANIQYLLTCGSVRMARNLL